MFIIFDHCLVNADKIEAIYKYQLHPRDYPAPYLICIGKMGTEGNDWDMAEAFITEKERDARFETLTKILAIDKQAQEIINTHFFNKGKP